ncbi:MAG: hypothetical protein VKJ66_05560 [Synechococcus sp.]|nr:hypothetical protein [Synechococcus sp.]
MASAREAADSALRLAEQLQALSQVAETLTYRLLDLEERLVAQERRSGDQFEEARGAALLAAEATELRLLETEDRLARLEAMLSGSAVVREEPPHLQVVPTPQLDEAAGESLTPRSA